MADLRVETKKTVITDSPEVEKSKERLLRQWGNPVTHDKVKEASKKIAESMDRRKADDSDRTWVPTDLVGPSKGIERMREQLLASTSLPALGQEKV